MPMKGGTRTPPLGRSLIVNRRRSARRLPARIDPARTDGRPRPPGRPRGCPAGSDSRRNAAPLLTLSFPSEAVTRMTLMQVAESVGLSNSPLSSKFETPVWVREWGIDTWRLLRDLPDDREFEQARDRFRELGTRPERLASGHHVGMVQGHRKLWIEGHPAVEGLGHPTQLRAAQERLLDEMEERGWPRGIESGISRLDTTVTLGFADPELGSAFLTSMQFFDLPRSGGTEVRRGVAREVQTVYWMGRGGKKPVARVYDKGIESNSAPRGESIRLESQNRFQAKQRFSPEMVSRDTDICGSFFKRRFAPLAETSRGVMAEARSSLRQELMRRAKEGDLTERQAEQILGYLEFGPEFYSRATRYRRRSLARKAGVVLADPMLDGFEFDPTAGIELALAAWEKDREEVE